MGVFTDLTRGEAWDSIRSHSRAIRRRAQTLHDNSLLGPTPRPDYFEFLLRLDKVIIDWEVWIAVPGLAAYVQNDVPGNPDLSASYTQMRTAAITMRDWLAANIPDDGAGGAILYDKATGDPLTFPSTGAVIDTFRTNALALVAAVNG